MKNFKFVFLLFISNFLIGQTKPENFSTAVLLTAPPAGEKYIDVIMSKFNTAVGNISEKQKLTLYDWDDKTHALKLKPSSKENLIDRVIFTSPSYYFEQKPRFSFATDTLGNTTSAKLEYGYYAKFYLKVIDATTSEFINFFTLDAIPTRTQTMQLKDPIKEFGGDPAKLQKSNPKTYNMLLEDLIKKKLVIINEEYKKSVDNCDGALRSISGYIAGTEKEIFEVVHQDNVTEKKVKNITFNGTMENSLVKDMSFDVLTKEQIGEYFYYKFLTSVYVNVIGEKESTAKTFLVGSSEIADAFKEKKKMILIKTDNEPLLNRLNYNDKYPFVNISFKKNCVFCEIDAENMIAQYPMFKQIERSAPELKYFANLYKNEKFIDQSVESLQGKQLGSQLLIENSQGYLKATDISTGRTVANIDRNSKFLGVKFTGRIDGEELTRIMEGFNPSVYGIKIAGIKEEKKDKIEEVYAYNPVGFSPYAEFDVVTFVKEMVDGEEVVRTEKIGEGRTGKKYSTNLYEIKIKKGEKLLFEALKNKKEVSFMYPIKK